jgi:hypothetical protein
MPLEPGFDAGLKKNMRQRLALKNTKIEIAKSEPGHYSSYKKSFL